MLPSRLPRLPQSTVHSSALRLIAIACAAAVLLAAGGLGLEAWRFGVSPAAAASRLERDVRDRFAERSHDVESLGASVARETAGAVARAGEQPDDLPALFDQLSALAPRGTGRITAATVTVYDRLSGGQYKILAWSDGPAENVWPDRLAGEASVFVAPGTLGLRLISVNPILLNGRRIAVAAAETVLAPAMGVDQPPGTYRLDTSFGPVAIRYPGGIETALRAGAFAMIPPGGGGFDVQVSTEDLRNARLTFRRRAFALAGLPLVAALLLLTGPVLRRRRRASPGADFLLWSAAAALMVAGAAAALVVLSRVVAAPASVALAIEALAALTLVALLPMSWWWRRPHRLRAAHAPVRFVLEQIAGGTAVAGCLWLTARLLDARITPAALAQWQLPLFRLPLDGLLYVIGLLLAELTLFWSAAMLLATLAGRWRVDCREPGRAAAAAALWFVPVALLLVRAGPRPPQLLAAATAVLFGLSASALRRHYRRTTQAMRLVSLFLALLLPLVALYPFAWFYADSTARQIVSRDYAPATARRPDDTLAVLTRVRAEIDRIPIMRLLPLVAPIALDGGPAPTLPAFEVWSETSLASTRLTAAIELYGADGSLVSRFALNMPEYQSASSATVKSLATTCSWGVYGEAVPFGAEERDMLHARRQVCDPSGHPHGAILVHVINDYQTLPFVSTPHPYRDVLRSPAGALGSVPSDLQVVVYGWSLTPTFTSGPVAWPITPDLFRRLYQSREPFWTRLDAEGRRYDVYFSNDSRFIYALGYPSATWLQHLTRLAEAATLMAVLFLLLLLGATVYAPYARVASAPLRTLLDEIRTSFYRKLFLFFVLAAIGPVLIFALAFGVYMTAKFRADVESEASTVVTVARRVLEQTSSFGSRSGALSDDVMVWVAQVVHQDVNLFQGPELLATSQRDLYASGLLPTRTPAQVYRAIALNRLPSFVGDERLGLFAYVVAAAPMPTAGRDFVLSVPLASRQREIEREIDELNRGVLVGAVFVILFAGGLGASVASRVSDPVARLSRATRQIAAGKLDVRLVADTSDELSRLIADFNSMAATLSAQRAELARTHQLKAWAEMARQVAHEIKNPLTPIQLAAEHLDHVHADRGRPLGAVFDQCVTTILRQVRLLRQIASEFSMFAGQPTPRLSAVPLDELLEEVTRPYRVGLGSQTTMSVDVPATLPPVWVDRTLIARALTNLVENAVQAMPNGGSLRVTAAAEDATVVLTFADTGVGMDADAATRAFEPYFSTKTAGSGLGLANARRNIETCGGSIALTSTPGRGTSVIVTLPTAAPAAFHEAGSTPDR
jgi:signal transduction histidine kinase